MLSKNLAADMFDDLVPDGDDEPDGHESGAEVEESRAEVEGVEADEEEDVSGDAELARVLALGLRRRR